MQPGQLDHFAWAVIQLGFAAGVAGAVAWSALAWLVNGLADALTAWEQRRMRIAGARARAAARGMGQGPMSAPSRAACPVPSGTASPARLPLFFPFLSHERGASERRDQHSAGPRGEAQASLGPSSCPEQQAAGAPVLAVGSVEAMRG